MACRLDGPGLADAEIATAAFPRWAPRPFCQDGSTADHGSPEIGRDAEHRIDHRQPARREAHVVAEEMAAGHRRVEDVEGRVREPQFVAPTGGTGTVVCDCHLADDREVVRALDAACVRIVAELMDLFSEFWTKTTRDNSRHRRAATGRITAQ